MLVHSAVVIVLVDVDVAMVDSVLEVAVVLFFVILGFKENLKRQGINNRSHRSQFVPLETVHLRR